MKILFYPEVPHEAYVVYKICRLLGYEITSEVTDDSSLSIAWSDTTIRPDLPLLKELAARGPVVNLACRDISKTFVDEIFEAVFGYCSTLNPLAHQGVCVKKSNANATHDGEILSCPIANTEDGFIYQRLIDNRAEDKLILDLRVPIFKGVIPLVYLKYRDLEDRFGNENHFVNVVKPEEVFSAEEQHKILLFCQHMGFELGELDVLRDQGDHKLYIIDANHTPYGPPNHTPFKEAEAALAKMAQTFEEVFLSRAFVGG